VINTEYTTPWNEEKKEKNSKNSFKAKSPKGKSKKIIDDDSEEYILSEYSEEEYKKGKASAKDESDEDYSLDEIPEENNKSTKIHAKKLKNSKETPKKSGRNNKTSNSMDIDDEELELIEEQFKEMETKEKEVKNKNNKRSEFTKSSARYDSSRKEKSPQINIKSDAKKIKTIIPECDGVLTGLIFVLTGALEVERDTVVDLLKGYGAKVTSQPSKKTNYLLHGDILEDGRSVEQGSKYNKAVKLNVKLINQAQFENLMREKLNDPSFTLVSAVGNMGGTMEINLGRVEIQGKNQTELAPSVHDISDNQDLWATKHSPKDISEVVGNQKTISQYITWLDDWHDVVINNNKKKVEFKMGKGKVDNPNARACLISGDPGIGKTTVVRLIAKLKGYRTYELNASDQRNKAIISSKLGFLLNNKTLNHGEIESKNLIIMDEVDGMGGNEDRGGIAALIDVIKRTKVPIVCIANDKQNQKLRSLVNHCYDLSFNKPDKRHIVARLQVICKKEDFSVESNALEYLCESVGNDIRQCINFLEFWSRKFKHLKYFDMSSKYDKFNKDASVMMSNFEAAKKILDKQTVNTYYKFKF
jgi:replication factor C subunit 1